MSGKNLANLKNHIIIRMMKKYVEGYYNKFLYNTKNGYIIRDLLSKLIQNLRIEKDLIL